mmetsp:Transcript_133464/g.259862  ORF Transcript_133464/g.259862 Transcript_133464/m.259862 type:complete len:249 (+) Transcript_133464:544-1290(+)
MVDATKANVVGPAITTHHPHARPAKEVPQSPHLLQLCWQCLCVSICLQKTLQSVTHNLAHLLVILLLQPLHQGALHLRRAHKSLDGSLHNLRQMQPALTDGEHHAQAVICVVLKQTVAPSWASARLLVNRVGNPACCCSPDTAAPCGVRKDHALPKELCQQFGIRCFAAALACPTELQQWLIKLGALNSKGVKALAARGQRHRKIPSILVTILQGSLYILHYQCIVWAGGHADFAAGAVHGTGLNAKV